jgi:hypothetical protein
LIFIVYKLISITFTIFRILGDFLNSHFKSIVFNFFYAESFKGGDIDLVSIDLFLILVFLISNYEIFLGDDYLFVKSWSTFFVIYLLI